MEKKEFKALKVKELIELLQNNSDENATVALILFSLIFN